MNSVDCGATLFIFTYILVSQSETVTGNIKTKNLGVFQLKMNNLPE
jgi:hypothetical protein